MAKAPFTFNGQAVMFPTPLMTYTVPDAERINATLLEEIAVRRSESAGVQRSNRAGWHSETDFFERTEPAHVAIAKIVGQALGDATKRLSGPTSYKGALAFRLSGWINVNPTGAYNVPHDHPGHLWSGCYYIKNDAALDQAEEGGGAITFIDSRSAPAGQSLVQLPAFRGSMSIRPRAGTLLLFPSTVKHWVHPNTAEEERVSLAFNATVTRRTPGPARAGRKADA